MFLRSAVATIIVLLAASAFAADSTPRPQLPAFPPLSSQDRLLVLAPHEDDETLGAGGLIQQALSLRAAVRVVYLTYGDHNELAFLFFRKRPWLTPGVNRAMGEVRRGEAIQAMAHLGLAAENLVFCGYPDNGTLTIWKQHWKQAPPLHSFLTNTRRVPYKDAFSYGKSYKGEEIVADLERLLLDFRPTRILVTHPLDANPDHRALYLFLQVALLNLEGHIPAAQVFSYPIHMGAWPRPLRYHPESWLTLPQVLVEEPAADYLFELSDDQVRMKYEAIRSYRSQTADHNYWLVAFARRNELFSVVKPTLLEREHHVAAANWSRTKKLVPIPDSEPAEPAEPAPATNQVAGVTFRQSKDGLLVQLSFRRPIDEDLQVGIFEFGYRRDRPFPAMPKLDIQWDDGSVTVRDQTATVRDSGLQASESKSKLVLMTPWTTLGLPDAVFVQVQGVVQEVPVSQTGWQVLLRAPFASPRSKP